MNVGFVYRCYDSDDHLRYVGQTMYPVSHRMVSHRSAFRTTGKSAWVVDIVRVEIDTYPSWQESIVAEAALIAALDPDGNKAGRQVDWSHSRCVDTYRTHLIASRLADAIEHIARRAA